tara:strand:- start:822 stop:1913 length:1092 start_codon:yes stop_codon:yes gene_type:complete
MRNNKPIYVIAEIGVNHNGSIPLAKELILKSKKCGANAVKFQTYKTDNICDIHTEKAKYQTKYNKKESQYKMLKKYELSINDFILLKKFSEKNNIDFLTTAADVESLNSINKSLKLQTIKVGSSDLSNIQLLLHLGKSKKKIILSCGMSTLKDIDVALSALSYGYTNKNMNFNINKHLSLYKKNKKYLNKNITLLHCTTEYPAPLNELNLHAISTLENRYKINIGYSDHSHNLLTPVVAAAKGISMIEVHVTKSHSLAGPDHKSSLNFPELKIYINNLRKAELMLGSYNKIVTSSEKNNKKYVTKRLFFKKIIKKGQLITDTHLACKRSLGGILSSQYPQIINKKITKNFKKDSKVNLKYIGK